LNEVKGLVETNAVAKRGRERLSCVKRAVGKAD